MAVRPLPLPALVEANQTRSHWCHSWPQPVHMEISSPAGKTEPKTGSQKPSLFQNGLLDYSRLVIRRIRRMACDNPQYIGLLVSLTFTNKILTSAHFTFSSSEPKKEDKYFKMGCIIILYIYTYTYIYTYIYIYIYIYYVLIYHSNPQSGRCRKVGHEKQNCASVSRSAKPATNWMDSQAWRWYVRWKRYRL